MRGDTVVQLRQPGSFEDDPLTEVLRLGARRYNVNANQVFTWRREYREPPRDVRAGRFVPVVIEVTPDGKAGTATP